MASKVDVKGIGMTSQRTRTRLVERLHEQGIHSQPVLSVISETPRHAFVDEALAHRAYEDTSLPIGFNQTISRPFVVARMTEALFTGGKVSRVLEIGTGCGYQTAVLAQLAEKVYTVERVAALQKRARERLASVGYGNISFRHGDGNKGWGGQAPFDAIMVTAASAVVPETLTRQLGDGGRMLVPVGSARRQELLLITRKAEELAHSLLGPVKFVPLLGGKC